MRPSSGNPHPIGASTVGDAIDEALRRLRPITERPRLEAEVLLAHLLGRTRVALLAHPEIPLTETRLRRYFALVDRRAEGEPLPYLTGEIEFFGLPFTVTPEVLIPRPETEQLVDLALRWMKSHPVQEVVDVGTGSGCIAVALAVRAPDVRIYATDLSVAALEVARTNAERHGVARRITFLHGDLLAPLLGPVDLIVSNPPYVANREWETLPPSVRQEPREALLAGPEGLDVLRRLLSQAGEALRPDGLLLVEIGEHQGAAVQALARRTFPEAEVQVLPDLAGKDRVLRVGV